MEKVRDFDLRACEFFEAWLQEFLYKQDNSLSRKEYNDIASLIILFREYREWYDDLNWDEELERKEYNKLFRLLKKYFDKLYF